MFIVNLINWLLMTKHYKCFVTSEPIVPVSFRSARYLRILFQMYHIRTLIIYTDYPKKTECHKDMMTALYGFHTAEETLIY